MTDGFRRVLDLAHAALEDPTLSGEELAARVHLSRFHFDRLVAAAGGEAPGALRRRVLMERAAYRLIAQPRMTVLTIALEAGYASHEGFTRSFVRAYGMPPTQLRADPPLTFRQLELPSSNGVHFHPPGGIRLPAPPQETSMDITQMLVDHHVESLTALITAAAGLPDDVLDKDIVQSIEGIDDEPTLRGLLNAMVTQEEHWLSALRGGAWPDESDRTGHGLARRHERAGRDFQSFVRESIAESRLADTFVDTTCEPMVAHSLGGTIAHVITFAAVRRTMAVGALWTAGVRDMEKADPRPFVDALVTP